MKHLRQLERAVFERRSRTAAEALLRVLDDFDGSFAPRIAAAATAVAANPGFSMTPALRTKLLGRRAALRAVFEASPYGSAAHLATAIAGTEDGRVHFGRPEQIDKYMVFCPLADLDAAVLEPLERLPLESLAPLVLSFLTDPPSDVADERWQRILALAMRLGDAPVDADALDLARRAWLRAPGAVGPMLRRYMLEAGAEENDRAMSESGALHLVVAAEEAPGSAAALLEGSYRVTYFEGDREPLAAAEALAALEPDITWLPDPGAAVWTTALASVRTAPLQIAPQGAATEDDLADAVAWLAANAKTLEAA